MIRARRCAALALAAGLVLTAGGCPADGERTAVRSAEGSPAPTATGEPHPARPTDASTGLPAYTGPPAGAPPSTGPPTSLRAAVDLSPASPGIFPRAEAVVAVPGGGAHVLLSSQDPEPPQRLVTVGPADGGVGITGWVQTPRVAEVWGMHLLGDGTVAIAGQLPAVDGRPGGSGFHVVDPATGSVRTTVVAPYVPGTTFATGRSALDPAGRALYLFHSVADTGLREELLAVDVASGQLLATRDLAPDVAAASGLPAGRQVAGLLPRPGGGATLVFDASPTAIAADRIPTLLTFDLQLQPVGAPVLVTHLVEGAETQAVAAGIDGTVFLLVEVTGGTWLLAVPDGGGAGPVLAQLEDRIYDYALMVEPAQVWALLPAPEGARAVDLTTGEAHDRLRLGCAPRLDVRDIVPAATEGTGALLIGQCDTPRVRTPMLWIAGSAPQ